MSKKSEKRQYPRQAWVLLPSFKPKEVTIIEPCYSDSNNAWEASEKFKPYHIDSLFLTKEEAIAAGRVKVKEGRADIAKRQANLDKRIAALDKAEAA